MFLLASLGFASFAQDYDKVRNAALLKNYTQAKTELDKILANPRLKDKTTGLYWSYALNAMFYGADDAATKYPGADSIAFAYLAQYEQADTSLKALKENNSVAPGVETLRITGFNNGVKAFNNKNPQEAYHSFSNALKADDFLSAHGFLGKNFVDTNIVLYSGYAAQNSGDLTNAVKAYTKLIDNNIKIDSKDFENSIYYVVLNYYSTHNDQANFQKYADVVKKLEPQYAAKIDQLTAQNMASNTALPELVAKYKAEQNNKLTETQLVTYAENFAQPDKAELAKLDSAKQVEVKLMAADAFSKAYAAAKAAPGAEDNTGLYSYNAGILYYNVFQDLDQRFYDLRGEGAGLKAKRDVIEKDEIVYADNATTWFTNAYEAFRAKTELGKREKSLMLNTVKNLANIYQWKMGKARGVDTKAYDKYEALYKQFDTETDKYSK